MWRRGGNGQRHLPDVDGNDSPAPRENWAPSPPEMLGERHWPLHLN